MAPLSSIQFVDAALNSTGQFALSYADAKQKWLIRKDLVALLQDFPSFSPSMDTFIHNDGSSVKLLYASGSLPVSGSAPPVPLIIWLHDGYPALAPMVFVTPDPGSTIQRDHPFVDQSGIANPPYLKTWEHPRCKLSDLVRNLEKLFSKAHPLVSTPRWPASSTHPSLVSKMEAIDRLSAIIHSDIVALRSEGDQEVEDLLKLQEEMRARAEYVSAMMSELQLEKSDLESTVGRLDREAKVMEQWLGQHEAKAAALEANCGDIETVEGAFDAVTARSRSVLECSVERLAIEDTIYALDKAVEHGTVDFKEYIKQVRVLAREEYIILKKEERLRLQRSRTMA